MKKVIIKDIEIQYNEEQADKIDYIINIISKNYSLFLDMLGTSRIISLIPTTDKNIVYISNFDEEFYSGIDKCFNNDATKQAYNTPNIMSALYIEILIRKLKINSNMLVQSNSSISDEMLDSLIAYKYFEKNGSFSEFVEYLKTRNESDLIFNWLKNEIRWDTYNYLLEITVNFLKENDFDFLENISGITTMMLNQSVNNILTQVSENTDKLPSISLDELEKLFYEFLKYINAPESWKQMYDNLKNSGRITFENQVDNIDNSMCYKDENDILRLLISTDGTIKSFCTFVHEFVHYISWSKSQLQNQSFSITEFPSIYFEKLSAEFLKSKGYQSNIIDKVISDRKENNLLIYMGVSNLFYDLLNFIKNGPIERQSKIEYWENHFRIIQETKEKLAKMCEENGETVDLNFLERPNIDIPSSTDNDCDALIVNFIENGLLVINGYQYLLGTFLADEVLKQTTTDSTAIVRMINVTNELGNMNLQNILFEFDIQELLSESKEKDNSKNPTLTKKITPPKNTENK